MLEILVPSLETVWVLPEWPDPEPIMSQSPDSKEVAHYTFTTEKNNREFVYEMKLLRFEATEEYCFLRRWYYSDMSKKPVWRSGGWHRNEQEKFNRKVVQKRDIMKYTMSKNKDKR